MENQLQLWPEGEKIPDDRIREIYRHPPLVPTEFPRGTLIIGSKGSGKTTLMRYQKEIHSGISVHIALATVLSSLPKQSALGPLSMEFAHSQEQLLINKAVSLLALSIASRVIQKGVVPPWDPLRECIPSKIVSSKPSLKPRWVTETLNTVSLKPLENFESIPQTKPLVTFLSALGEVCYKEHGHLLLLLDRADLVAPPALLPILEVLDQSEGYVALVATRPGHGGATIARLSDMASPGDQYDVVYLGLHPRSEEWQKFTLNAIEAQLGRKSISLIAAEVKQGVLILTRDSVRTALEAFARSTQPNIHDHKKELIVALEALRDLHLVALQSKLRQHHPDFRGMLKKLRDDVLNKRGSLTGPVLLTIEPKFSGSLFEATSRLSLFIEASLRTAALCMPEGEMWIPGLIPECVEIPPLFLWNKKDSFWTKGSPETLLLTKAEGDFFKASGGPSRKPTIFVAYRMQEKESLAFRRRIEEAIGNHPTLSNSKVEDGRVHLGVKWPKEIRNRIRKSKLVIGDATGMRPDCSMSITLFHQRQLLFPKDTMRMM